MTTALWCVLAAALLPYLCAGLAKFGGRMPGHENKAPREWLATLQGWPQRANWAQANSFETFPAFAAAVLVAQYTHAPQGRIDLIACTYIGLRLAYIALYVADLATLRSLVWMAGMACMGSLFFQGA